MDYNPSKKRRSHKKVNLNRKYKVWHRKVLYVGANKIYHSLII